MNLQSNIKKGLYWKLMHHACRLLQFLLLWRNEKTVISIPHNCTSEYCGEMDSSTESQLALMTK